MSERTLIIKLRALGDTVLATAAAEALFEATGAPVDMMVPGRWAAALQHLPFVDRIIAVDEPRGVFSRLFFWLRVLRALRQDRYARVAVLHASFRTALVGWLASRGRGVAVVNHHELSGGVFHRWIFQALLSDRAVADRGVLKSNMQRDLDTVRALGFKADAASAHTHLHLSDLERAAASDLLGAHGWSSDQPLLWLGIGASRMTKRWPAARFRELMKLVRETDLRWRFVIVAVKDDEPWLAESGLGAEPGLIHLQDLNLRQAMAVMGWCQGYVGNDSGFKHVAAALGLPTVTVFGPEDPAEWHPYALDRHPFYYTEGLPCRTEGGQHWCSLPECTPATRHGHQCMEGIGSRKVFDGLVRALKAPRTS